MNDAAIVLRARDISRAFPGVQALSGAELTLRAGEVHALMGQNGAGKSTLIKVLTGVHAPDSGSIELQGQTIAPRATSSCAANAKSASRKPKQSPAPVLRPRPYSRKCSNRDLNCRPKPFRTSSSIRLPAP